jgi:hypothetical protein
MFLTGIKITQNAQNYRSMVTSYVGNPLIGWCSVVTWYLGLGLAAESDGDDGEDGGGALRLVDAMWSRDTWGLALPPNPTVTTARTVVAPSWVRAGVSWPFSVFTCIGKSVEGGFKENHPNEPPSFLYVCQHSQNVRQHYLSPALSL